jgi:hypothetical protein
MAAPIFLPAIFMKTFHENCPVQHINSLTNTATTTTTTTTLGHRTNT